MKLTPEFLSQGSDALDVLLSRLEQVDDPTVQETVMGAAAADAYSRAKQELLLFVIAKLLTRIGPGPDKVVDHYNAVLDDMVEKGII